MDTFETELIDALRREARNAPKFGDAMSDRAMPTRSRHTWGLLAATAAAVAAAIVVPVALTVGDRGDGSREAGFADGSTTASPSPIGTETLAPLDQRVNDTVERLKPYRSRPGFGAILITHDVVTVLWDGTAPSGLQDAAGLQPNGTTIRVATSPLTNAQIDAAENAVAALAAQHGVAVLSYGPTPDRGAIVVEINMAETPPDSSSAQAFAEDVAGLQAPVRIDYVKGKFVDR